jgi:hypothetical protein
MIFQHHTARITQSEAVNGHVGYHFPPPQYGRAGCIPFQKNLARPIEVNIGTEAV